ncbi:MAG: hypothetical protein VB018_14000, partial [Lachnospiraceae bacterium]|nr:hypothetical protein [Lachnospiraceae bacterium]
LIQYFPFIPLHSSTSFFECSIDYFTAAIKLQNLTAIFLHFITVIDSQFCFRADYFKWALLL